MHKHGIGPRGQGVMDKVFFTISMLPTIDPINLQMFYLVGMAWLGKSRSKIVQCQYTKKRGTYRKNILNCATGHARLTLFSQEQKNWTGQIVVNCLVYDANEYLPTWAARHAKLNQHWSETEIWTQHIFHKLCCCLSTHSTESTQRRIWFDVRFSTLMHWYKTSKQPNIEFDSNEALL